MSMNVVAIVSMLHEDAAINSATRMFRQQSVLSWTLRRAQLCDSIGSAAILCWEDQLAAVAPIAEEYDVFVMSKAPRQTIRTVQTIATSRRWADGWRGGLMQTCDFDTGYYGPWHLELLTECNADAAVLIDPSAGLIDPKIVTAVIEAARSNEAVELAFSQAPPGLGGIVLKLSLIERLNAASCHPGKLLHYLPDQPSHDPISRDGCVPLPVSVSRSRENFRLDSQRQIRRITEAAVELNGSLARSDSEDIVNRFNWTSGDELPREMTVELSPMRVTKPIFLPTSTGSRSPMSLNAFTSLLDQFARVDDLRLTFGGLGDPICHPQALEFFRQAAERGIATQVETDLLPACPETLDALVESGVDLISFHLPATSPKTYCSVMGVDRMIEVVENIKRLVKAINSSKGRVPLLVPLFVKTQQNIGEMESWYDQWLRAIGSAVVRGPTDFAGQIDDVGVADMAPARRKPCRKIQRRLAVLSDGRITPCEQDIHGIASVGSIESTRIETVWTGELAQLRGKHGGCNVADHPLCGRCREWHRP